MLNSKLFTCGVVLELNRPVTGMELVTAMRKVVPAVNLVYDPRDTHVVLGQVNPEPIWDILVVAADTTDELAASGNQHAYIKAFTEYKRVGLKNFYFGGNRLSMHYSEPEKMFVERLLALKKALEAELNK